MCLFVDKARAKCIITHPQAVSSYTQIHGVHLVEYVFS